ncbi:MAG TPA: hypothetical protein VNT99_08370 [Methylomirabilota bacterium]|nr:hypothetical protein [Methylomirabilota bacterium]
MSTTISPYRRQRMRQEQQDASVRPGLEKSLRIDLGIALLHSIRYPHISYTRDEIAYWAGCTDGAILLIEQRAKRKLINKMLFGSDPHLREIAREFSSAVSSSERSRPRGDGHGLSNDSAMNTT